MSILNFSEIYSKDDIIFVAWSGGLDSTYFIWKALNAGFIIKASYFEIMNNYTKTKRELKAIERILPLFQIFPNFEYLGKGISVDIKSTRNGLYLCQILVWLTGIIFNYSTATKIAICYVMNDDAVSYVNDIYNLYDAYIPFMHNYPKLTFPLLKTKKSEELAELPFDIISEITFCEGDEDNCGYCGPCLKWKTLERDGYVNSKHYRFNKGTGKSEKDFNTGLQIEEAVPNTNN
jgi:hypothetical protein